MMALLSLVNFSFGEHVKMLHPFHEQFSNQSGAKMLQQFTFEQNKTKIAQVCSTCRGIILPNNRVIIR